MGDPEISRSSLQGNRLLIGLLLGCLQADLAPPRHLPDEPFFAGRLPEKVKALGFRPLETGSWASQYRPSHEGLRDIDLVRVHAERPGTSEGLLRCLTCRILVNGPSFKDLLSLFRTHRSGSHSPLALKRYFNS